MRALCMWSKCHMCVSFKLSVIYTICAYPFNLYIHSLKLKYVGYGFENPEQ